MINTDQITAWMRLVLQIMYKVNLLAGHLLSLSFKHLIPEFIYNSKNKINTIENIGGNYKKGQKSNKI